MLKTGTGSWFFNRKCQKSLFPFPVFNFQGFTLLFWQKVGRIWPFLANFLGISTGSSFISAGSGPKSADFSKFSRLHALCGKKFWKLAFFPWKNGIGNRKSADFSNFSRLHALCGKKFWKLATGNGNRVQIQRI